MNETLTWSFEPDHWMLGEVDAILSPGVELDETTLS